MKPTASRRSSATSWRAFWAACPARSITCSPRALRRSKATWWKAGGGGGGYIRITRLQLSTADMIMHIINAIGNTLDAATARAMTANMVENSVLDPRAAELVQAAVSEKALAAVPRDLRDMVRAAIYKNMLLVTRT